MIGCVLKNSLRKMSRISGKGVELKKITKFLEDFAPISCSESWDNTGLLVEPTFPQLVDTVLLTNDLTEEVVTEALNVHAGLIISYHPPIFKPLMKITTASWKGRIIATCLENKIAVYSPHTSWDCVPGGINDWLASAFFSEKIEPIKVLEKEKATFGAGRFCKLGEKITISEAIEKVKKLTGLQFLNLALAKDATLETMILDVAICAGSGSSVLNNVRSDLYLTGEMQHHDLLNAIHNGSSVILCNHSNSERGFLKQFSCHLEDAFGSVIKVLISQKDRDPLQVV